MDWLTPERKIALYLAIVFVVSWSIAVTFLAVGGEWNTAGGQVVMLLFTTPPMFAALIVKGAMAKDPVLEQLGIRFRLNRWWLVAWLLPLVVFLLTTGVAGLIPGVSIDLSVQAFLVQFPADGEGYREFEASVWAFNREQGYHPAMRMLLEAMGAGITINALRGLGEEIGWRGLMPHEMKQRELKQSETKQSGMKQSEMKQSEMKWNLLKRSLVIGAIWGVWYAPLILGGMWFLDGGIEGVALGFVWCVVASPVFGYLREKSESVIPAAIFYGGLAGLSQVPLPLTNPSPVLTGVHGVAGIIAMALVLGCILLWDRRSNQPVMATKNA